MEVYGLLTLCMNGTTRPKYVSRQMLWKISNLRRNASTKRAFWTARSRTSGSLFSSDMMRPDHISLISKYQQCVSSRKLKLYFFPSDTINTVTTQWYNQPDIKMLQKHFRQSLNSEKFKRFSVQHVQYRNYKAGIHISSSLRCCWLEDKVLSHLMYFEKP